MGACAEGSNLQVGNKRARKYGDRVCGVLSVVVCDIHF